MYQIQALGTDTEVFLKDSEGNSIPAVGLIGGTKKEPRPIDNKGSALQEDNVMLEFNTIPAHNSNAWVNNINKVLVHVFEELRAKGLVVDISPSVEFKEHQLMSEQAKQMGCEPDASAWTGEDNELISPMRLKNLRTAGGHIHVSFKVDGEDPRMMHKRNLIRMLDITLGVPSILLDDDSRRREFYGRAGAYRNKADDRVEYRTLSNFWIKNDTLKEWAFNGVVDAIRKLNSYGDITKTSNWGEFVKDRVIACIRNSDRHIASDLIRQYNVRMP
jgi:hypothetical protein